MSGSTFGKFFTVTTWGESHGPALGAIVDGCPAGIHLTDSIIQQDLNRRRPGQSEFSSARQESDKVQILSGVFQGLTTGTPISLIIYNQDYHSQDYYQLKDCFRPGHADHSYFQKYQRRDYRGGGRASGRETAARVGAGAIARQLLAEFDIEITAYTYSIGNISIDQDRFEPELIRTHPLAMPDKTAAKQAGQYLAKLKSQADSAGGIIECIVTGIPPGLGEPVFNKLDALLAKAVFSIGAVKAVEIGSGIKAAKMTGSEHNDFYRCEPDGSLKKLSNNAGGILGGISDGFPLKIRAHFKPTPSIAQKQKTVNTAGENIEISIDGRHDPIIVPRAVVVVEAMVALTLADCLIISASSNIDRLKRLFK